MVVLHHLALIAHPVIVTEGAGETWSALRSSPLAIVTAGTEWVQVFFVLSGVVLTLPALAGRIHWRTYYPSRLLRLYLPVWGALLSAGALILLVPRPGASVTRGAWITDANAPTLDPVRLAAEATLWPASYDVVNTLWSLRWELLFSLVLPVAVLVAARVRRAAFTALVVLGAAMVTGRILESDVLTYLPAFLAGAVLASRVDGVRTWAAERPRPVVWAGAAIVGAGGLVASHLARPIVAEGSGLDLALWGLAGPAAVLLVTVAIGSPGAERILSARLPQWLGTVSFSLYLVHAPIVATLAFALGDRAWLLIVALGIPLSLLGAAVFHRLIERPSHRLARTVSRRLSPVDAASAARLEPATR